ncbi:hypothetical protein DFH07DRAFT_938420 [Mycena maculata]|uniref:Uncharacterized protein n=1 Tax=Mycena maculata TaxID=230809 RepID=A0AAD7JNQ5_9AGAR|nr:hypothetical protein DFH07DRAFT_938420 [Mycena maculata]
MPFAAKTLLASILSPKGAGLSLVKAFLVGARLSYFLTSTVPHLDASKTIELVAIPTKTILAQEEASISPPILLGFVAAIGCVVSVVITSNRVSSLARRVPGNASNDEGISDSSDNSNRLSPSNDEHDDGENNDPPSLVEADQQGHGAQDVATRGGEEPPPPPPPPAIAAATPRRPWSWRFALLLCLMILSAIAATYVYHLRTRPQDWSSWFKERAVEVCLVFGIDAVFLLLLHYLFGLVRVIILVVSFVRRQWRHDCTMALVVIVSLRYQRQEIVFWLLETLQILIRPLLLLSPNALSPLSGSPLLSACHALLGLTSLCIISSRSLRRWVLRLNMTKILPAVAFAVVMSFVDEPPASTCPISLPRPLTYSAGASPFATLNNLCPEGHSDPPWCSLIEYRK